MVFSSIIFLFLYLPVVLAGYYLLFLPRILGYRSRFFVCMANLFLLGASLVFYFWGETTLIWIIIASTLVDYFAGLIISGGLYNRTIAKLPEGGRRTALQKFGLVLSICSNLAFLGYFKYAMFAVGIYDSVLKTVWPSATLWGSGLAITLPLGISFYTFQSMSYTIDVYRGRVRATRNLIDFTSYVTMFPQLVAGPIVRYSEIAAQLVDRRVTSRGFASGVSRFILGLGKKVLVANTVAITADKVFALPGDQLTTGLAWLGVVSYTVQIYFDFSGYSDMAIGLGRMLGFDFPENFNYPYIARSLRDFWRRWHISLTTWFRDYLYIPLGGNRRGVSRTYLNLLIVFFLCGLWHGASAVFVAWGLYHGAFLVLERLEIWKFVVGRNRIIGHAYTILIVMLGWVLFRSETFSQAMTFYSAMAGFASGQSHIHSVAMYLTLDIQIALVAGVLFAMPVLPAITGIRQRLLDSVRKPARLSVELLISGICVIALCAILALSSMSLAAGTHNPFIYFRF